MKKITLLFILCIASITLSYGQCTTATGGQWPAATVVLTNSGGAETIATNNWPNAEFSLLTGILPGSDYTVVAAGPASVYITVTNTANNAVIVSGTDSVFFTAGAGVTALTIYWHLDAACNTQASGSTLTTIQCTTCTCTATAAPGAATAPTPADAATGVTIIGGAGVAFSWIEDTTGDIADSFTISIGLTTTGDDIGSLADVTSGGTINFGAANNTLYYWKIEAVNCFGSTTSAVWSFTTTNCTAAAAPNITSTPSPADAATNAPIGGPDGLVNFTWVDGGGADPADSFTLNLDTVNPPVANSFTNFGNGNGITGLTVNTQYFWSVDAVNCFGTTSGTVWSFTTDAALSIDDNEIAQPFKVYPNPTSGILNIKTSLDIDNITVFNLLGQRVANFNKNSVSNNSINLSELSQGLYIIKISAGDRTQTFKITKE